MAKRGTPSHPKILLLAELLGIDRCYALGIVEALWHWSSRYAIDGELTKWSPKAIVCGVGYSGEADQLIESLVQSGLLDRTSDGRTGIHDVHEHADNTWKECLAKTGRCWWNGEPARLPQVGRPRRTEAKANSRSVSPPRHPSEDFQKLQRNSNETPQPKPEPQPKPQPKPTSLEERSQAAPPPPFPNGDGGGALPSSSNGGKLDLENEEFTDVDRKAVTDESKARLLAMEIERLQLERGISEEEARSMALSHERLRRISADKN